MYVLRNMNLIRQNFFQLRGLAWKVALKKNKVKLDVLADINMLLTVEKGFREEICQSIYQDRKANTKYINDYDKNRESLYLQIGMQIIYIDGQCRKSFQ